MTHRDDDNTQDVVVDRVEDSVVAYTQAPAVAPAERSTRGWTRIPREQLDSASYAWKVSWIDAS